jgi:dTDP-3-amino-3,4,6-trideoxy-alpha-D-glucose transaminase
MNNGMVEIPRVVPIQMIQNEMGMLGVVESYKHSPFVYERFYFMTDLARGSRRGGHAHKTLRQVLICLRGSGTIDVRSTREAYTFQLQSCDEALVLPPGYWRDLYDFSDDALVGALASANYDEADYIRDWEAYALWDRAPAQTPVPYLDLARYATAVGHRVVDAMRRVVFSGQFIGGNEVTNFETSFAAYCDTTHAVGVGNGLQALTLSLRAAGIGRGDEVILPANSFIATALAVIEAGAIPVLVDVEASTGLICVTSTAAAITERTAAIIPVHLYGHPCDMDGLAEAVDGRDILILEDACQAHGALYKGRRCGSLGGAAAFSFYPTKNLGAVGDGGAVTTNDAAFAARVRLAGNYGSERKYEHVAIGTNSRLDPVQAAALGVKLPYLERWNATRAIYAEIYRHELQNLPYLILPHVHHWAMPVWHVFPVRVPANYRAAFIAHMAREGIGTNIHYPIPIHLQPCFRAYGWGVGSFPVTEQLAGELVSLPLDPTHTPEEIDRVVEAVRAFFLEAVEPVTRTAAMSLAIQGAEPAGERGA